MTHNEKLKKYKHYVNVLEEEIDTIMDEHISVSPQNDDFISMTIWSDKMVEFIKIRDYYLRLINDLEKEQDND